MTEQISKEDRERAEKIIENIQNQLNSMGSTEMLYASWQFEEGVLISGNTAKWLLDERLRADKEAQLLRKEIEDLRKAKLENESILKDSIEYWINCNRDREKEIEDLKAQVARLINSGDEIGGETSHLMQRNAFLEDQVKRLTSRAKLFEGSNDAQQKTIDEYVTQVKAKDEECFALAANQMP